MWQISFASEPEDLGEIKVVESGKEKSESPEESHPSFVTVIKNEELDKSFNDLPEVLEKSVGVRIKKSGGLGDFSTISIRGSSSEQVLVYLDGILLNESQGGGVNLGNIPFANIDSIEIYRGSSPVTFGASGIGGIVNIKTKFPESERNIFTQLQYGSFETYRANIFLSHKPGKYDYFLGLNYTGSDNDFKFEDDNGTKYNKKDDETKRRKNNDFNSLNFLTKFGYDFNSLATIKLTNNLFSNYKGVSGISNYQSEHADLKTLENLTSVDFTKEALFLDQLNFYLSLYYSYKKQAFDDKFGEIGVGRQDNKNVTQAYGTNLNFKYFLGEINTLNFLINFKKEIYHPFDKFLKVQAGKSTRETFSAGIEDEISLFNNHFIVVPSFRKDFIRNRFSGDNGGLIFAKAKKNESSEDYSTWQVGFKIPVLEWFSLRANIGRYYRVPSFFELFGDRGGVVGNSKLVAEEGWNRDVGFRLTRDISPYVKSLILEAVYFENRTDNLILFIQNSQRTSKPENISKSENRGFEFSGSVLLADHLRVSSNYTIQNPKDKSRIPSRKDKILPGRAKSEFNSEIELFNRFGKIFYSYNKVEKIYLDPANLLPIRTREIHNIGISASFEKNFSATFEVKNASDNRVEDATGYPLPGRAYFLTLTWNF